MVDSLSIEEKGELLGHAQEAIEAALETVRVMQVTQTIR